MTEFLKWGSVDLITVIDYFSSTMVIIFVIVAMRKLISDIASVF